MALNSSDWQSRLQALMVGSHWIQVLGDAAQPVRTQN